MFLLCAVLSDAVGGVIVDVVGGVWLVYVYRIVSLLISLLSLSLLLLLLLSVLLSLSFCAARRFRCTRGSIQTSQISRTIHPSISCQEFPLGSLPQTAYYESCRGHLYINACETSARPLLLLSLSVQQTASLLVRPADAHAHGGHVREASQQPPGACTGTPSARPSTQRVQGAKYPVSLTLTDPKCKRAYTNLFVLSKSRSAPYRNHLLPNALCHSWNTLTALRFRPGRGGVRASSVPVEMRGSTMEPPSASLTMTMPPPLSPAGSKGAFSCRG